MRLGRRLANPAGTKTKVALTTPPVARDWIVDVPIFS